MNNLAGTFNYPGKDLTSHTGVNLPRSLSAIETFGLGITGPAGWIGLVVAMHTAIGSQAIFVWLPATFVGILLNYQVKHLGMSMMGVAGGTPNYTAKLFKHNPGLARYAAIGYLLNWVSALSMSAVILADLIKSNLTTLGITCPDQALRIGFVLLPFIVAFSGTRALSILHLFFIVPAIGLLVLFSVYGLGWLALSTDSPGFFPSSWSSLSFVDWAKWFYFATFSTYSSETASSFVAESRDPKKTLRYLDVTAWLGASIFVGGSWVVARLATGLKVQDDTFPYLVAASQPFWGNWATLLITFLLASSCLLTEAAAVSNCPRILYQLSVDQHLSPVFKVVSKRGVFGPSLTLIMVLSLLYLLWGDADQIVVVGNVGWFVSFMLLHLGLWLHRRKSKMLLPRLSLLIFVVEVVILLLGGFAWGWKDFLIGLLLPLGILVMDAAIRGIGFAPFHSAWWLHLYQPRPQKIVKDSLMFQVSVLIFLLCGSVLFGWWFRSLLDTSFSGKGSHLILVLMMVVAFVGVAIACWTTLPQVIAISEAREVAEVAEVHLHEKANQLEAALHDLQQAQIQLIQSEKMSSLGQLVAGVAHEINNPVNFIHANLIHANNYTQDLMRLMQLYQQHYPNPPQAIKDEIKAIDLEFLSEDLTRLLKSMNVGTERICEIIHSLRNFSRLDEAAFKYVDIHEGIDSTLMILQNRFKANSGHPTIEIIKKFGKIPLVGCYPGQINQVFMNLLANALDALEEQNEKRSYEDTLVNPSKIWIYTEMIRENWITIRITDNGLGMSEAVRSKLFDPFFTTKPVGKGTGLGLSISYQIVTLKHNGRLYCNSEVGQGAEFVIEIPINQN